MADNNDLKVVVGLDLPKSVLEIKKDLVKLAGELAGSDDGKLKIVGQLDIGATEKLINTQLSKLKIDNTALKITPTIDTSSASQLGNQITKQLDTATQKVDFSAIARNLRKAFNINDNASIKEATENIKAMYEAFNVDPEKYKNAFNSLISWYEQRSNDLIYTEKQKVEELNGLLRELYNQPDIFTKLPGGGKHTKSDPLFVTKNTLEEMKSLLGSMQEVYKLFGVVRVDDKHGALTGSFLEDWDPKEYNDGLAACIKYLQKIQELRNTKRRNLFDTDSKENIDLFIKSVEQTILKQLNLVDANNKIIQSNRQVAQSERDIAQAQQEVNNTRPVSANGSNDLLKQKGELANQVAASELKILGLEQQLQTESQKLASLRAKETEAFPFSEETDVLNKQVQEAQNRYNATKQMLDQENATHTALNEQMNNILSQIEQEKQRFNQATQNMNSGGNGSSGVGASANYFSSNSDNILAVANSAKEAEEYYKRLLSLMGDTKGVVTSTEYLKGAEGELKAFTVAVKSGTGAFETFRYTINEDGAFDIGNITAANAGIQRLAEQLEKLKSKYNTRISILESNNPVSKSILADDIAKFREQLDNLGKTTSIKEVETAFNNILTKSAEITSNLKSASTSLNPQENALNHYREMESILSNVTTQYDNLVVKNNSLDEAIKTAKTHLGELKDLQINENTYADGWDKKYHEVNVELANIVKLINEATKAEGKSLKADKNSQYQKQLEHLKKIQEAEAQIVSLNKRRISAGEAEKAEIDKQLKAAKQRVVYHTQEYEKKKAIASIQEEINRAENNASKQNDLTNAKAIDNLTAKYKEMSQSIAQGIENMQKLRDNSVLDNNNSPAAQSIVSQIESVIQAYRELLTATNEGSAFTTVDNLKNDVTTLKTLEGIFNGLEQQLRNVSASANDAKASVQQLVNNTTSSNKLNTEFDNLTKSIDTTIYKLTSLRDSAIFRNHSANSDVVAMKEQLDALINKYEALKATITSTDRTSGNLNTLKGQVKTLGTEFDAASGKAKQFQTSLRQSNATANLEARISRLTNQIKEYMAVNTKASKKYSAQFTSILDQASVAKDIDNIRRLEMEFGNLKAQIKLAHDTGKTFGQMIVDNAKKFTMWFSLTSNVMRAIRSIKQMISTVKELDTAMTALRRVTEGTKNTYDKFFESAIANAKELKMNLVDLITQSAEWAKRGYDLSEVSTLAKASGIYSVVADIDNATAVQHLTTVLKTYNMTADEAVSITDRLDNIANRYAVTAGDLGEILSHSITSMQVSGNSLDQAIAMGTAIAQITGNANEAGSTLKVLSMRLRGASTELVNAGEDTEGMAESTSKLREKIMALTNVNGKGGFDIMADADIFKSTYEIMEGISKVWKDISDVNQAALLEVIAGKMRGNTVATLLTHMADANDILTDSLNSQGVALEEYQHYLESVEGKWQGLSTSAQAFASAAIDDSTIKGFLDLGTGFLNVLTDIIKKFGTLQTLLPVIIGLLSGIKNVGRHKMSCLKIEYADCNVVVTRNELMVS